ncbi:MAG: hypothetical protein JWR10_3699 [Rubritepida sp.]|nr:hypothetical protein [Rubritepida sp.]
MQTESKALLDRRSLGLGHQTARPRQRRSVQPDPLTDGGEFIRIGSAVPFATASDMDAEFAGQLGQGRALKPR